eukprot:793-Pyramimonas_sp.AAC.1
MLSNAKQNEMHNIPLYRGVYWTFRRVKTGVSTRSWRIQPQATSGFDQFSPAWLTMGFVSTLEITLHSVQSMKRENLSGREL